MTRRQASYTRPRSPWGAKVPRSLSLSTDAWSLLEELSATNDLSYSEVAERLLRRPDNGEFLKLWDPTEVPEAVA